MARLKTGCVIILINVWLMQWNVYVNGLFEKAFRRYVDAYAFRREWKRDYPNDLVLIRRK